MPRAVAPWTWRQALRDHGPVDSGFLLSMLMLATYMNRDGYAYPSQATLAKASRRSVRMLRRYINRAEEMNWLAVVTAGHTGQGWRHHGYRACVPDEIPLTDADEDISRALEAQLGEIQPGERADTVMSSSSLKRADTSMAARQDSAYEGADIQNRNVRTSASERGDTSVSATCGHGYVPLTPPLNSRSLNSRSEEARLAPSVCAKEVSGIESEDTNASAIRRLLEHGVSTGDILRMLGKRGITIEHVRAERERQAL